MKKFILSEMMLLSPTEKKAKRVKFDRRRTLIYGKNGTGKSCLIKSIYKTFGANPYKDHPTWKNLDPVSLIKFKIDNVKYSILKDGKFYAVFDSNDELIDVFDSVTNKLGPFLADLFDFRIKLPNQQGEQITPPPAFLFLPYYVDQDISWQSNWSGFSNLQQVKSYREPIVSYHTGLKPNDYYTTKGEIEEYSNKIKELELERKSLKNVLEKVKEKISETEFNINIEDFKEEIKNLLVQCEILKGNQENLKAKLVDLYNLKISIESQITIAKSALNETRKDYKHATQVLVDDHVNCPTCGAEYENSFLERFEIAKDEDRCKELLIDLTRELSETNDEIEKENLKFNRTNEEIVKIEIILENKKGEVRLKDVIDNAGRNQVKKVFEENSQTLLSSVVENAYKKEALEEHLKALLNKEKRESILSTYRKLMHKNLNELDVKTLKEDSYRKIDTKIPETGSALPRALIAYYFSIFELMKRYTSSAFCPIIIDSPNQQAQDLGHVDKILKFINGNQPEGSQLILGIEELYKVDFNCKIIELKSKQSLLQSDEYEEVSAALDMYQTKIWNSAKSGRLF
jgi:hypothetical protein